MRFLVVPVILALTLAITACSDENNGGDGLTDTSEDSRRRRSSPDSGSEEDTRIQDIAADEGTEPDLAQEDTPVVDTAVPDTTVEDIGDAASLVSPECLGFCNALCTFLEECDKHIPNCVLTCAQSPRYQQLSAAACNEGTSVIGLEDCRLWRDCNGMSCAIDEMCLEIIPNFSYECAAICDLRQAAPACPGDVRCTPVTDAASHIMTSLGMCWSLF